MKQVIQDNRTPQVRVEEMPPRKMHLRKTAQASETVYAAAPERRRSIASLVKRHWPLFTAIGMLWIVVGIGLMFSISLNQGYLVYALDDTYIHMAMAKNLAQHGVWGVTKYGFSSSSSSLLWTLSLASVYLLFGVNDVAPLILNLIFATVMVFLVYAILKRYKLSSFFSFVMLLSLIFLNPLPSLVFCGQEHILYGLLTIASVYLSARILSDRTSQEKKRLSLSEKSLLLLSPFVTMARYEGIFLVFVICLLFVARRRLRYSLMLGGLGILPLVIHGWISVSKGWYFLPNSVLLKGATPDLSFFGGIIKFFGYSGYYQTLLSPHILFFILAALVVFILQHNKPEGIWRDPSIMIIVFIATTLLHMQFAKTIVIQFMRYEAYLVALGLLVTAIALSRYLPGKLSFKTVKSLAPKYAAIALLIILVILPLAKILVKRGFASLIKIPRATTNIYQQQYQMGLFLREFYQGAAVAANDVGAINYLADIRCLDLWGLGSIEVAKEKKDGDYHEEQIYHLAKSKDVKIAVVYDDWFLPGGRLWEGVRFDATPSPARRGIPSQWIKAGEWKIRNNVICNRNTVSFYAVDSKEADILTENLKGFSSRLPKDVVQTGKYTE